MTNKETGSAPTGVRRFLPRRRSRWMAAAAAVALAAVGVLVGLARSSVTTPTSAGSGHASTAGPGASAGNARSGPAAGGAVGTVTSVAASEFVLTTSTGQRVTVSELPTTIYLSATHRTSVSVLTDGKPVLVLGTISGTAITATQVVMQPATAKGSSTSSRSVIPFQRGAPMSSKQVGEIPAGYTEGVGSIVSGPDASRATEAALAAYPGGIVDRVVKLSDGEFEVHNIGVSWPHHVFVSQAFQVAGAA